MTPTEPSGIPTQRWILPALLCVAVVAAFWGSFRGVFVFDDIEAIVENPTIRRLDSADVLFPPSSAGQTVGGRPVLNLTFALNHAVHGLDPLGYHLVNLLIHVGAALALYGIVRRTLILAPSHPAWLRSLRPDAPAFAAALLWALHPLQTESVTYIVQRAESLMGMFYLLTLYCFIRGSEPGSARPRLWFPIAAACCFLGMATKEVMASAPVIVLLYDRCFLAGTFAEALRRRRGIHLVLASSWLLLATLIVSTRDRGGSAGFGVDVGWWDYALTQGPAILHYLRLTLWPAPLIFDYGAQWMTQAWPALAAVLVVAALAALALWGLVRNRARGLAAFFFFAILAPTSLVPATRQTISEHRLYLALVPLALGAALGLSRLVARTGRPVSPHSLASPLPLFAVLAVLALPLGLATARRHAVYEGPLALWTDTVAKRPGNPHAHGNLGRTLAEAGRLEEAEISLRRAVELQPRLSDARGNLATVLLQKGDLAEALLHYEAAAQLTPDAPVVHLNLGRALIRAGRTDEAVGSFRTALRLDPALPAARLGLANAHGQAGRYPEAAGEFTVYLALRPDDTDARFNFAYTLDRLGRRDDAIRLLRDGEAHGPRRPDYFVALGSLLAASNRPAEAAAAFERALLLDPNHAPARNGLQQLRR